MLSLSLAEPLRRVLVIGCHADDIEIGCGGTLLTLARANPGLEVDWVVLTAAGARGAEARASAEAFLAGVETARIELYEFRDGFLPYDGARVKEMFERECSEWAPNVRADMQAQILGFMEVVWNEFFNPDAYRDAGVPDPYELREVALASDASKERWEVVTASTRKFFLKIGLFA